MQKIAVKDLIKIFLAKWKWLLIGALVGALVLSLYAVFVTGEQYTAEISLYVQNVESGGVATSNNLAASQILTNTYVVILEDADTMEKVVQNLQEPMTVGQMRTAVSVTASDDTAIIKVSATTDDPKLSRKICQTMCTVAPGILREVVNSGTVTALGEVPPAIKTGPRVVRNALFGVIGGLFLAMAAAYIAYISDTTVKSREDLQEMTGVPLLGEIPSLGRDN